MRKTKATTKIKQMLHDDKIMLLDPESGYKYILYASCPNDTQDCSVSRYDRTRGRMAEVTRVIFKCPLCGNQFTPEPEEMFLY